MTNLSQQQEEMRQSIQKGAMVWSIILGLIVAGIAFWALAGQSMLIRSGAAAVGGLIVLVGVFKWRFAANSKSAQCGKCSTAFSISKTDHVETLTSSTPKETREAQEDHSTKVTTWTEEVFSVVDTYTCANCDDSVIKEYTTTRKKDEKSEVEAAPVKKSTVAKSDAKSNQKTKVKAAPKPKAKTGTKTKKGAASKTTPSVPPENKK